MEPEYKKICIDALGWAREQDYKGYSKFDALNSPLLAKLAGRSRLLRGGFVFGMSRMPVNLRPLLFVPKNQNPKGLALFARAYFNLYEITGDESFKEEGLRLLDVLSGLSQREKYSGHCWGYDYPWQNIAFFIPAYEPNCVVTCAAGEGFLRGYHLTGKEKYLEVCQSIAEFILRDLKQINIAEGMRCCSYDLNSDWKVINVNAMTAAFLAKLFEITNNQEYKTASHEMMRWVISQKTDYHGWYYTDPPEASRITHDGYHTGFVLDAIDDYLKVFPDAATEKVWGNGLRFYKENLFGYDFAPKWMYDRRWPADIHGGAQGIITFTRASASQQDMLEVSKNILDWTLENLYSPKENRFYFQKGKYWTKKFTLMRRSGDFCILFRVRNPPKRPNCRMRNLDIFCHQ